MIQTGTPWIWVLNPCPQPHSFIYFILQSATESLSNITCIHKHDNPHTFLLWHKHLETTQKREYLGYKKPNGPLHIPFLPQGLLNLNLSPECAFTYRHDNQTTSQPTRKHSANGWAGCWRPLWVHRPFSNQGRGPSTFNHQYGHTGVYHLILCPAGAQSYLLKAVLPQNSCSSTEAHSALSLHMGSPPYLLPVLFGCCPHITLNSKPLWELLATVLSLPTGLNPLLCTHRSLTNTK